MMGLLALYLVDQLLLPEHAGHVAGLADLRTALEAIFGPLSSQAFASQIFGLYTGFVYFTPLFGGLIADRWIGQRNAVVLGALSMSAGDIAMAFDRSFLIALLLLIVGFAQAPHSAGAAPSLPPGAAPGGDVQAGPATGFAQYKQCLPTG